MNAATTRLQPRGRAVAAYQLMFPLAAAFAAVAVPAWLRLRGVSDITPGVHAHEMIFGFVLAVVSGFLVNRRGAAPWLLAATWVAARSAPFLGPHPYAAVLGLSFTVMLFAAAAPPLWRAAKRPENRLIPAVLGLFVIADAAWWYGAIAALPWLQDRAWLLAIDAVTLLVLVVGGRALPAAMGGHLERQGIARRDHVRHGYELPLAALLGGAGLADAGGWAALAGALCITAAAVTAVRMRTWQLQRSVAQPQLWTLALGYGWLVPGLLLKGLAQAGAPLALGDALHGVTVGAVGTLTLVMMARTAAARMHRPLAPFGDIGIAAGLISLAALLRLAAPVLPVPPGIPLWAAAGCWSAAFLWLLGRLLWRRPQR